MPSLEQISAWTIPEIIEEIRKLLPEGHVLVEGIREGWHAATIQHGSPEPHVLWSATHADRKHVLLNAFGWLWLRGQKSRHPVWKPRNWAPMRRRPMTASRIPDPPDLDPAEIRAVYEREGTKGKK